ncbi:MAG TPA: glycoside hydrolase family 3 N-terminal domain-containing protein [Acidimicrobiales bacterium]|nr:glycoside hydrolase family 3 N-terminal domain-containing protein [Acidimicrobiales bacterium]
MTTGRRWMAVLAAAAGSCLLPVGAWSPAAAAATASGPPACANPVSTWSVDQLVEQLLMVGGQFSNLSASAGAASAGVGGFVLFGQPPAGSGPAIRAGLSSLAGDAVAAGRVVPWFSTDEEGGPVARLSQVIGGLPSARQMAAVWTPAQVQSNLAAHGAAMRSLGVNMDLAPVLDVASPANTIASEDQRSFSDNPQTAAVYGTAFAAGLRSAGVVPVGKHFPGMGHASADTDLSPATDPPLSQLQSDDLIPFAQAAGAGIPVVMVGHPSVPGLTGSQPASLSPAAYQYLRNTTRFGGVALTDDLDAGAISAAGYSQPAAAVQAIEAGADMAMIDASAWSSAADALRQAVSSGALPLPRVEASVRRILAAKSVPECPTVGMAAVPAGGGYWIVGGGGAVEHFGTAGGYGTLTGVHLNQPVVGMAATPDGRGYWLTASDGGIFAFGDARFYGSTGGIHLNQPVVGIAPTPDGRGYWLTATDGGIFSFGDARFYGSGA